MDDPRPGDAADARKLSGAVVQQRIDQRSVRITRRGMDHESGGLVDDDQVLVLEHHAERNGLRPGFGFRRGRDGNRESGALRRFARCLRYHRVGDVDRAFAD